MKENLFSKFVVFSRALAHLYGLGRGCASPASSVLHSGADGSFQENN